MARAKPKFDLKQRILIPDALGMRGTIISRIESVHQEPVYLIVPDVYPGGTRTTKWHNEADVLGANAPDIVAQSIGLEGPLARRKSKR